MMPAGGTDDDRSPPTDDYYSSSTMEGTEQSDRAISMGELIGGSADDDGMHVSNGGPENHNDNALAAASAKTDCDGDKAERKDKSQDEKTSPPRYIAQSSPLSAATPSDTSSLLTMGMSLFTRGSRRIRPTRNENDAMTVFSEMSHDVKSEPKSDKDDDDPLRQHLEESGLVLLKRLIDFLSDCPPAPDEGMGNLSLIGQSTAKSPKKRHRGLTLPATAIGWIFTQIHDPDNDDLKILGGCIQVPKQQLECIAMLFKRVTNLRISGEAWPPPMPLTGKAAGDIVNTAKKSLATNLLSKFSGDPSSIAGDVADDASIETASTVPTQMSFSPFQRYYHELQSCPRVNMSFFPNATKVIIDGIPPNWVININTLKNLEMFQMEKGCIIDINRLFFPSDVTEAHKRHCLGLVTGGEDVIVDEEERGSTRSRKSACFDVYFSLSKLRLSHCAIGETAGLRGRRAVPRLPTFSRFPNLVSLNISHNELFKTKTALAGLSSLPQLSSLNLSYNRLTSLDDIYMYIGNVTELFLTGNEISSTRGLDRIFSLEHLALDENKLNQLTHIVGLANLPFLMNLDLKGNPFEVDDPSSSRVKVFNLFREVRCGNLPKDATFRDMQSLLPVLDKELATKEELIALKDLTFRTTVIKMDSFPTDTNHGNTDGQTVDDSSEISVHMMSDRNEGKRGIVKCSPTILAHLRIAGSTVLAERQAKQRIQRFHGAMEYDMKGQQVSIQFNMKELITSLRPEFDKSDTYINGDKDGFSNSFSSYSSHKSQGWDKDTAESSKGEFPFSLPPALLAEADDDTWNPTTLPEYSILSDLFVEDAVIDLIDDVASESHSNIPLLGEAHVQESKTEVSLFENSFHRADDGSAGKSSKSIFDGIWEHSYRDNITNCAMDVEVSTESITLESVDFNAAEEHSHFDGNPELGTLFVSNYLDLYFESFIFSKDSSEDEERDLCLEEFSSPKIQMFKFDRGQRPAMHLRERYIGVCKESVLACGSYARSRLSPKRIPKRTFHGDAVIRAGKDVMISESREYILCLSESALYFIIDDDIRTRKTTESKRSFPSRIPPNATFSDAYWPHALTRHPLDCLCGITIGFQFQRLILRFRVNSATTSSSLECTFVIITANKSRTVSLLQKIDGCQSGMNTLIENDDKIFLDALGALESNEVVLHYQILRQCWKRGDREAPMRSFVLTDLKVYLIDESYFGDGTEPEEPSGEGMKLGDVSLTIIDSAKLSRVTEVRAANEDPRKITLVLLPQNKLKRAHRWRLICNDGESAERLIDAVRKAIDASA